MKTSNKSIKQNAEHFVKMKLHSFYLFIVRKVRVADHPQEPEVAAHVLLAAEGSTRARGSRGYVADQFGSTC